MDVQPPETPGRFGLRLGVHPPPQVSQIDGRLCHLAPAFRVVGGTTSSRASSLHGNYPASSLLQAHPSPSRLRPAFRRQQLTGLPCSADFSAGGGGVFLLAVASLPPIPRYPPAALFRPPNPAAPDPAAFA